MEVSKAKNKDEVYGKEDVLSVSGDYGIVNQIEFQVRSFAGVSVAPYGVVETGDVVYTKSPLKSNPYGIIKANKGKPGIVSTLYAVYKPLDNVSSEFVQIYFEQDSRMNNYMHPLVNKGAKNDMKVSDENALKGEVCFPSRDEQIKISEYFAKLDNLITLHQCKLYQDHPYLFTVRITSDSACFAATWEQRKLSDVAQITMGQSPDGSTYSDTPSTYILVQGNADLKDGWVSPRIWTTQRTKTADAGDLIMSVRAPAGAMGKTAYNVVLGRGVAGIKGNEFLYQTLVKMDENGYWKKLAAGSTFESINSDSVNNAVVSIPQDIEEQTKIGDCLQGIDNLITLHQCKHLQDHNSSFVVEITSDTTRFTTTWEQRKLGDIVERVTRKNANNESELPLTISAQYGLIDQMEFFGKRIASRDISGYYLLLKGEFAYNKSTSGDAPLGAVKRLDRYENGAVSTLYITFAIRNSEKIDSDFLACYYDTDLWHKGVQAVAAEGARNHGLLNIAPADFFNTTLMVPRNIEEQKAVGSILNKVDNLITLHQCKHLQDHNSSFVIEITSDTTRFTTTWEQRDSFAA